MIFEKLWRTWKAQANKLANLLWTADPIAQMQYEYDLAVEQLKGGREGLEQYRALVERVAQQIGRDQKHRQELEAKIEAYLQANDRQTAGQLALELELAKQTIEDNTVQLAMHEQAYANNVAKVKQAAGRLREVREQIAYHKSQLKMTGAEAEIAKLASSFDFDQTTNFAQIEQVIHDKISLNRAQVRVAADLSSDGAIPIERQQAMENVLAEQALKQFEHNREFAGRKTIVIEKSPPQLGSDGNPPGR